MKQPAKYWRVVLLLKDEPAEGESYLREQDVQDELEPFNVSAGVQVEIQSIEERP